MTQHTFSAPSVREALRQIKQTLGSDAVILSQETRNGWVQVVATLEASPPLEQHPRIREQLSNMGFSAAFLRRLPAGTEGWSDIRRRLPDLFRFMSAPRELTGVWRFVGGAGSGKTTLLVKLLTQQVLEYGHDRVRVLSTDDGKLAANEALALACELLRVPFREVSGMRLPAELAKTDASLVLVDTAGSDAPADPAMPMARVKNLLVLPACWHPALIEAQLRQHAPADPAGVSITQIDRIGELGDCLSLIADYDLPLAWFGIGPDVPGALEWPGAAVLFDLLVRHVDRSEIAPIF